MTTRHPDHGDTLSDDLGRVATQALTTARQMVEELLRLARERERTNEQRIRETTRTREKAERDAERARERAERDTERAQRVAERARRMSDAELAGNWGAAHAMRDRAPQVAAAWDLAAQQRGIDPVAVREAADREQASSSDAATQASSEQRAQPERSGAELVAIGAAVAAVDKEFDTVLSPELDTDEQQTDAAAEQDREVSAADFEPQHQVPAALTEDVSAGVEL